MIYFDYTATTKPKDDLVKLHQKITNEYWYNTESLYALGVKGNNLLQKSVNVICDTLKVNHKKVLFTSGATEANNTAIYGVCHPYFSNPKQIITTVFEHASVLKVFKDLEKRGFKVTYLSYDDHGNLDLNALAKALTNETILVSIMWINNITGAVFPIKEIINIVKKYPRCKLHVDAVQGFGKIVPDFAFNDLDLITLSGHKLNGLKGTGALIYNERINLCFMQGGHQQNGIRPGTVDLAGAVVMAKAINLASVDIQEKYLNVCQKYEYLVNALKNELYLILNINKHQSPYILSITFKQIKGETVLHFLENNGIIVGTGSACNSKAKEQENTLIYTLKDQNLPINTIRISLSDETTFEELDLLITKIKEIGTK